MSEVSEQAKKPRRVSQKRKLINKVRKKVRKENKKLSQAYNFTNATQSGLGSYLNDNQQQLDFDMMNHISMGQNRKMKKKMKKLQKKIVGDDANEQIFKHMQKYKANIIKTQQKTIFNPAKELQKRRQRRMKRMETNAKKHKRQILQKFTAAKN